MDNDGIWDSQDDCVGVYDECGVCNGTGEDVDEDGLCDDVDDCVGAYDECGVCNGPGPNFPVIDEILYETDSVFIDVLGEWYVFEYATDTLFTYVCPVSGCTDQSAFNFDPEAVIDDGECVYEACYGETTVSFDGYNYDLVAIGDQCWFAENLRNEHYANGDPIPGELSDGDWSSTTDGAMTVYGEGTSTVYSGSDDEVSNLADYGRLYNWYAVNDSRGLCPSGWHVPTDPSIFSGEYTELTGFLGGAYIAGTPMKSSPEDSPAWDGTNTSGFSGLAGGFRGSGDGGFYDEGASVAFWSASAHVTNENRAWLRTLNGGYTQVIRLNYNLRFGFSVRCVRD